MRTAPIIAAMVLVSGLQGLVYGQWRENQEPVVAPPAPRYAPPPDVLGPFRTQYQAAGSPRVVLFWNVSFDDSTETHRQNIEHTQRSSTDSSTSLKKETQGPAGDATLGESDGKRTETEDRVTDQRTIDPAKQTSGLSARNAVELEIAFRQQLEGAGVRLLSRATSIRFTQAQKDRTNVDPKLIEADAVLGKADLLLEVVMVPDQVAPLRAGFKVTLTQVKSGAELVSIYTSAQPELPQLPSHYVATDSGFQRQQPRLQATVGDVGVALARDVMRSVGPRLTKG